MTPASIGMPLLSLIAAMLLGGLGSTPAHAFLDPPAIPDAQPPALSGPVLSEAPLLDPAAPGTAEDATTTALSPPLPPARPRAQARPNEPKPAMSHGVARARWERRSFEIAAAPPAPSLRCTGLCGRFILIGVGF